jgi:subtilisin family serine protease
MTVILSGNYGRLFIVSALLVIASSLHAISLSPSLEKRITEENGENSTISLVIFIDNENGLKSARAISIDKKISRVQRHSLAVNALRNNHRPLTSKLKNSIISLSPDAIVDEFWIAPVVAVTIPSADLNKIINLPGIRAVYENAPVELIRPVDLSLGETGITGVATHLQILNIPALWDKGLTGKGTLVCNFDTGVDGVHPALQGKWRGLRSTADASWFAPVTGDVFPHDIKGHGTHTMGLMVGSNDVDTFGVAPGAEWIGAAVIDQGETLSKTFADIISAFQWAADPDGNPATVDDVPDVVLNSWGVPTTIMEPCDETFYQVIDNVEAAGAITIFAAGNEGPDDLSLRLPANRASSPLNTFAIGAIDGTTGEIAAFSSRGPSSCNTAQKKPEVVAPGVNLYSCSKGGGYGYKSGTSMAAPLIAGLAVLLRQYNPEATVDEVKMAIIRSARDKGELGEDNVYGWGLPDAEAALAYMPVPEIGDFDIAYQYIGEDGVAEAGETFDLFVGLAKPSGIIDSVQGILHCGNPGVDILNSQTVYHFEVKSDFGVSKEPFSVNFANYLDNGLLIPMNLVLSLYDGSDIDTVDLQVMVGHQLAGNMITHGTDRISLTVTDFGQYGLGENSIFFAGGNGFRYNQSENLLYESGIVIGRNQFQLSSSIRDSLGTGFKTDFVPNEPISLTEPFVTGSSGSYCRYSDVSSEISIPITVGQNAACFSDPDNDNFIIMEYYLINHSNTNVSDLYFGFFTDFDLDPEGDGQGYLSQERMIYQEGNGIYTGIMPLFDGASILGMSNENGKIAFTNQEKYELISFTGVEIQETIRADLMSLVNYGPMNIPARDSVVVALVIAAGNSIYDLQSAALRSREIYFTSTGFDDKMMVLPGGFELDQNYPNPFNPSTFIEFSLPMETFVNLTVYNILGQRVRTLCDDLLPAGKHVLQWHGNDEQNEAVGSGIYFYRLVAGETQISKKMTLLK